MCKWLYIRSDNESDAYATASVIINSTDKFNIVRRSKYTQYFVHNPNVNSIGFADGLEEVIYIDEIQEDTFIGKCQAISRIIGSEIKDKYVPFVQHPCPLNKLYTAEKIILYVIYPNADNLLDILALDKLAERNSRFGYVTIDSGSVKLPPIHNCIDGRGIITYSTFSSIIPELRIIITNDKTWKSIAESLNIPSIFWNETVNDSMFLNVEKRNKLFFECSNILNI